MTLRTTRRALVTLAETATDLSVTATERNMRATAKRARKVAATLNSAVIRLDEDGPDYLEAAEAFAQAGSTTLADIACSIGRCAHARA